MSDKTTVLELSDVAFDWQGRSGSCPVLRVDALTIEAGERVFLTGASGSGKSTLIALIAGVAAPTEGKIAINGNAFSSLSGAARDARRADELGVIFQLFNLAPFLSVTDNVTLPCRFSKARRAKTLEIAKDLEAAARTLLDRLQLHDVDGRTPVAALSVGQQQRVAAARALIGAPSLILADEPTSALDEASRDAFISVLLEEAARAKSAVLLASHDKALDRYFGRTIALEDVNRAKIGGGQ